MKNLAFSLLLLSLAVARAPGADLVFPAPPDKPRIRFLYEIKDARDLRGGKREKGFFGKALAALAGGEVKSSPMKSPYDVAWRGGKLYIADPIGGQVIVADESAGSFESFGNTGANKLKSPGGVAVDGEGNFYVSDAAQKAVMKFSPAGKQLWAVTGAGKDMPFERPAGLAWGPAGELYVADAKAGRVAVLDAEGKFKRAFAGEGEPGWTSSPTGLAVDGEGSVFLSDPMTCRVHIFKPEGAMTGGWGEHGDGPGYLARPRDVAVDSDGNVYVSDAMFGNIQIFTRDGRLLMHFGGHGTGPAEFQLPSGLAFDGKDRLFVADSGNSRIQVFQYIKQPADPKP